MSDKYQPPPGPPPSYQGQNASHGGGGHGWSSRLASNNPFASPAHASGSQGQTPSSSSDAPPEYSAPSGPPPGWQGDKKQPLPRDDEYAPPSGPPPSHGKGEYAPPTGPPPSHQQNEPEPPPYDPWMQVPDNALLPPPPSFREETSPTANATYDDAKRAHTWCRSNPLWQPRQQNQATLARQLAGDIKLTTPPGSKGVLLYDKAPGRSHVRTSPSVNDTILLSDIPIYTAFHDSGSVTNKPKTIYFELKVIAMGSGEGDAGIAMGFLAPPYPSWRLPGWHRASLGVHGDDGRRYVDDSYGGKDFVNAFAKNDVVGIGMMFSPGYGGKGKVDVFFTRNGKREAGWDLHEERDKDVEEGDVTGLEGQHDLLAAVGVFGQVEFEAKFTRELWMFRP